MRPPVFFSRAVQEIENKAHLSNLVPKTPHPTEPSEVSSCQVRCGPMLKATHDQAPRMNTSKRYVNRLHA